MFSFRVELLVKLLSFGMMCRLLGRRQVALLGDQLHCHGGAAAVCRLLDSRIDLSNPAIDTDGAGGFLPGVPLGLGLDRAHAGRRGAFWKTKLPFAARLGLF